jgi:hypothetical protein
MVLKKITTFCASPVPRSASSIVKYLQGHGDLPKKTRAAKAVPLLRERFLALLISENRILELTPSDPAWASAQGLSKHFNAIKPRRIGALYQTNVFCLQDTPGFAPPVVDKEANLQITALLSPFLKGKLLPAYSWNIWNLFWAYRDNRTRLRIEIYRLRYDDEDKERLEAALERGSELAGLSDLPFKPDLEKAIAFLQLL